MTKLFLKNGTEENSIDIELGEISNAELKPNSFLVVSVKKEFAENQTLLKLIEKSFSRFTNNAIIVPDDIFNLTVVEDKNKEISEALTAWTKAMEERNELLSNESSKDTVIDILKNANVETEIVDAPKEPEEDETEVEATDEATEDNLPCEEPCEEPCVDENCPIDHSVEEK